MTHMALAIDSDPERREQFLTAARRKLTTLPGIVVSEAECCDLVAVWGTFADGPQTQRITDSSFALILGDVIPNDHQQLDVSTMEYIGDPGFSGWPDCNGFYLAVAYRHGRGLMLAVDLLGMFPLYYRARPETLVAATSCELCLAHPHVKADVDLAGLTGILLTNGLVANQPLLSDLRRLASGHQLHWVPSMGCEARQTYQPEIHCRYLGMSFEEAWQMLDDRMIDAIRRHRANASDAPLLLSGGLDSRMLAGYLATNKTCDRALVLGRDTDHEVIAASQVASVLGMSLLREPHESTESEFLAAAKRCAKWEHLEGGFSALEADAAAALLGELARLFGQVMAVT